VFLILDIGSAFCTSYRLSMALQSASLAGRWLGPKPIVEELASPESPSVGGDQGWASNKCQGHGENCGGEQVFGKHLRFLSALTRKKPGAGPGLRIKIRLS
jgi:hypothetical protein